MTFLDFEINALDSAIPMILWILSQLMFLKMVLKTNSMDLFLDLTRSLMILLRINLRLVLTLVGRIRRILFPLMDSMTLEIWGFF